MDAAVKVSVVTIVRDGGAKQLGRWGKKYEEHVTVQSVIDETLEKMKARDENILLELERVICCSSEAAVPNGTDVDIEDLHDYSVKDLHSTFGCWLVVCVAGCAPAGATPKQLPSAFQQMTSPAKQLLALPTAPQGERFDFRLQRALISHLQRVGLGFPSAEANTSGADMIRLLASALQYLLPFDDASPSPLRLAGRVHLELPARFNTEVRACKPLYPDLPSLPSTLTRYLSSLSLACRAQALGERTSEHHHGAKPTEDHLSAATLQAHATKLSRFIGGPRWSELAHWQPFMDDVSALIEGVERLAAALMKNAAAKCKARQQTKPRHTPDDANDVDGSGYKLRCPVGECHDKYKALRECVPSPCHVTAPAHRVTTAPAARAKSPCARPRA